MAEESNQSLANPVVMVIQSWTEKASLNFFLNIQYLDNLSQEKELLCKVSYLVNGDKSTLGLSSGCGGVKLMVGLNSLKITRYSASVLKGTVCGHHSSASCHWI